MPRETKTERMKIASPECRLRVEIKIAEQFWRCLQVSCELIHLTRLGDLPTQLKPFPDSRVFPALKFNERADTMAENFGFMPTSNKSPLGGNGKKGIEIDVLPILIGIKMLFYAELMQKRAQSFRKRGGEQKGIEIDKSREWNDANKVKKKLGKLFENGCVFEQKKNSLMRKLRHKFQRKSLQLDKCDSERQNFSLPPHTPRFNHIHRLNDKLTFAAFWRKKLANNFHLLWFMTPEAWGI